MRSRTGGLVLLLSLALVACDSDDGPLSVGDPLNTEEAAALAGVIVFQGVENGYDFSGSGAQAPAQAPAQVPIYDETTLEGVPCPLGGTVDIHITVDGDVDQESGDADVDITQEMTHHDCEAEDDETGLIFILNGEPSTTFSANVTVVDQTDFSYAGSLTGDIGWATDDDRSGSCKVQLDFDMSGTVETSFAASVDGHVCGVDISRTLTIGETT